MPDSAAAPSRMIDASAIRPGRQAARRGWALGVACLTLAIIAVSPAHAQTRADPERSQTTRQISPSETAQSGSALQDAADWGQVITAAAAVAALIIVPLQLSSSRARSREQHTLVFQHRWSEPQLSGSAARVIGFLRWHSRQERDWKGRLWDGVVHANEPGLPTGGYLDVRADRPRCTVNEVYDLVAFFEELGGAYNSGLLDARATARFFRTVSNQYYQAVVNMTCVKSEFKIKVVDAHGDIPSAERTARRLRKRPSSGSLEEWGIMNRAMQRGR